MFLSDFKTVNFLNFKTTEPISLNLVLFCLEQSTLQLSKILARSEIMGYICLTKNDSQIVSCFLTLFLSDWATLEILCYFQFFALY